jgi:small subunit ribosomal protein S20
MANTPTARKRVRQIARRTATNRARISRIRTFTKKVETALAAGDVTSAREALKRAEPEIARGVTKGVLHKNTAARKISRLSQRVKKLQATA